MLYEVITEFLGDLLEARGYRGECGRDIRVEVGARPPLYDLDGDPMRERRLIDAPAYEGVVYVDDSHEAPRGRDIVAGQPARIARTVPFLMMGPRDLPSQGEERRRRAEAPFGGDRITSYNVCYTKLLRALYDDRHSPL